MDYYYQRKNVENLIKIRLANQKFLFRVLDAKKHKDARGLNLELDRYVKGVIDFCIKVKNLKNLDITIDLGCNFNEKINYYVKNSWCTGWRPICSKRFIKFNEYVC